MMTRMRGRRVMMHSVWVGLVWLCVSTSLVGFFLPWVSITLRPPGVVEQLTQTSLGKKGLDLLTKNLSRITVAVRRGAETITGTLPGPGDIPTQVSGFQIPQVANRQELQAAIALIGQVIQMPQDSGIRSYAVYLVPGLAIFCGLLLTFVGRIRALTAGVALVCAAMAAIGFWKLLTMETTALWVTLTIGPGLWCSLWGYAGLSLMACARAAQK